jgi:hypothetical protein
MTPTALFNLRSGAFFDFPDIGCEFRLKGFETIGDAGLAVKLRLLRCPEGEDRDGLF